MKPKKIKRAEDLTMDDFVPDSKNANRGTKRGIDLLERSFEEVGAGRGGVSDKHCVMLAGNKSHGTANEKGLPVRVVDTDGTEFIMIRRTDLDINDDPDGIAQKLAIYDNRCGEVGLEWDPEVMRALQDAEFPLGDMFFANELNTILNSSDGPDDPNAEWQGMPEFEQENVGIKMTVHFMCQEDKDEFCSLIRQPKAIGAKYLWHPEQEKQPYGDVEKA